MWVDSCRLIVKQPMGYGIATAKILYPVLCSKEVRQQQPGREWNTLHNLPLQLTFETGLIGLFLFMGWVVSIVLNVLRNKNYIQLAGLAILCGTSMVHFPDRTVNCVLVMIMFLAYCSSDERQNALVG
jgi:O-antigen ligase